MRYLILLLSLIISVQSFGSSIDAIKYLPVEDGGRIKPYDSFATESLQLLHGRSSFKGKPATVIVFSWMLVPEVWNDMEFVQVRSQSLREALGIKEERVYFSPKELWSNSRIGIVFQELTSKRQTKEKLNPFYQSVATLENQLFTYQLISQGKHLRVWPDPEGKSWKSVSELEGKAMESFSAITAAFMKEISESPENDERNKELPEMNVAVQKFIDTAKDEFGAEYVDFGKVNSEVSFNKLTPYRWGWVLFLLATIMLVIYWMSESKKAIVNNLGWLFTWGGVILMIVGMAYRTYIMGRPPVTNMYETVIWVPFVAVLCAMIFEKVYKYGFILPSATIVAVLCLILSDMAPAVLDPSLSPLEPVLRDNFWLVTHVLLIVSSYGAFFLAFAIGDLHLFYYLRGEKKYKKQIRQGVNAIYRAEQVGIVLLAAGTILGGVWADYSWGRFWGWDPKETWAFIVLMGYLGILHGRLSGWFQDFAMVVGSILAFNLVIMAWYGVNFVLGAGLHSYGFGAGGVEYVSAFAGIHFVFVAYVIAYRQSSLKG